MKELPILFSAPMVRALLAGTKTQTRRPLYVATKNVEKAILDQRYPPSYGGGKWPNLPPGKCWALSQWRKAQPGDLLWVRESWMPDPPADGTWNYTAWAGCRDGQIAGVPERFRHPNFCNYAATWLHGPVRWTPSIHMPRWACRITREVVSVRVERLQDISEADARAEGCTKNHNGYFWGGPHSVSGLKQMATAVDAYRDLWESINGPDSWAANPWVVAIEFKPLEKS